MDSIATHASGATSETSGVVQRACVLIPAYEAAKTLTGVVADVARALPELGARAVIVVDDGSHDGTSKIARGLGVHLVRHEQNRGKGAALVTGLTRAAELGFDVALTIDADGQHPAESARKVLFASDDPRALVLGVRDLARDGAPRKNQISNAISNFFLSHFAARRLQDTQCGLRRYPIKESLALAARAPGYAFEAEILLRAIDAALPVIETPVVVVYPPEGKRVTHFDSVRDPAKIVVAVVRTLHDLRQRRRRRDA